MVASHSLNDDNVCYCTGDIIQVDVDDMRNSSRYVGKTILLHKNNSFDSFIH